MEYTLTKSERGRIISLKGPINEDAGTVFQEIIDSLQENDKNLEFNFQQVTNINSLGVRCWVSFLRSAEAGRHIFFSECTPDIITQINMIPSFLGKAKIESFYVNYICETCQKEENRLIQSESLSPRSIPEIPKCEKKSCDMQTEELEEEYFVFLLR